MDRFEPYAQALPQDWKASLVVNLANGNCRERSAASFAGEIIDAPVSTTPGVQAAIRRFRQAPAATRNP